MLQILASDPRDWHQPQTRWTLRALRDGVPSFWPYSLAGVWRILARHRLRWKRARDHIRSPDPAYQAKRAYLATIGTLVEASSGRAALLYEDEVTYYRQPSVAAGYAPAGRAEPRAERSVASNTATRVVGALDAHSGRVVARQRTKIDVPAFIRFLRSLVDAYPGQRLYVVLDNWPVHFHPDVLAALEPQTCPFPFFRPSRWPTEPSPSAKRLHLPIQLVPLPTYASWLNPIEKLWRKLKQDVLHLHRLAHDLPALRSLVRTFLARFEHDSPDLLRYVGLHVPT